MHLLLYTGIALPRTDFSIVYEYKREIALLLCGSASLLTVGFYRER